ncbi:MAG: TetR/AcrR family transcriptional regulator [Proteobacteria bacterium]|nr:MAG: TetR/AcrR family transcriptional regulator [Pseudomonadota bacterium]
MKQQQILVAATKVFMEHGFSRVSMDQITKDAKVSKATLYAYYKSKHELFGAVLKHYQNTNKIQSPQLPTLVPTDLATFKESIKIYIESAVKFYSNPSVVKLYRLLVSEICQLPELFELLFESQSGRMTVGLANYINKFSNNHTDSNSNYLLACQILDLLRGATLWTKLTQNPVKQQLFKDNSAIVNYVYTSSSLLIDYHFKEM